MSTTTLKKKKQMQLTVVPITQCFKEENKRHQRREKKVQQEMSWNCRYDLFKLKDDAKSEQDHGIIFIDNFYFISLSHYLLLGCFPK